LADKGWAFIFTFKNLAVPNRLAMETILCPTDFSPSAENAIRYADELAQRMNSSIVLFHSISEPYGTDFVSYTGVPYPEPQPDAAYRQAQQAKLEELKATLQDTDWGMPIAYQTRIEYGPAKDTIPQVARQVQADLIVLGKESTDALKDIFLGSITGEVISQAACPVLLIPPKTVFRQIHRIVFATDLQGEPFIEVAFVSKLASLFSAHILFLHILTQDAPVPRQRAQAELDQLHKRLSYKNASFFTQASSQIQEGILGFCRLHKADLLVMGYHPRPFWQQLFDQHHARQMAYEADLPLLVIHYPN
jgi:nucleotide-binding universal stress UspA family protein